MDKKEEPKEQKPQEEKPKGMATVVQDDPLDVFENDNEKKDD